MSPRPLEMHRPTFRCRCGKVYAMSERDADGVRRFIAKKKGDANPVRYYQCDYGGWHWTRQLAAEPEPEQPKAKAKRVCGAEGCEKTFIPNKGLAKTDYCTSTCANRAKKQRKRARKRAGGA